MMLTTVMTERPLNAETPIPRLRSWITSNAVFFDRNQGDIPQEPVSTSEWRLLIEGLVEEPFELTYDQITRMPKAIVSNTLEFSGNGRSLLTQKASGNPWTIGGMGNAMWGGCNWGRGGGVYINHTTYNSFNRTNISSREWNHNVDHRTGCNSQGIRQDGTNRQDQSRTDHAGDRFHETRSLARGDGATRQGGEMSAVPEKPVLLTGNHAVAWGARLARPKVAPVYPLAPTRALCTRKAVQGGAR